MYVYVRTCEPNFSEFREFSGVLIRQGNDLCTFGLSCHPKKYFPKYIKPQERKPPYFLNQNKNQGENRSGIFINESDHLNEIDEFPVSLSPRKYAWNRERSELSHDSAIAPGPPERREAARVALPQCDSAIAPVPRSGACRAGESTRTRTEQNRTRTHDPSYVRTILVLYQHLARCVVWRETLLHSKRLHFLTVHDQTRIQKISQWIFLTWCVCVGNFEWYPSEFFDVSLAVVDPA